MDLLVGVGTQTFEPHNSVTDMRCDLSQKALIISLHTCVNLTVADVVPMRLAYQRFYISIGRVHILTGPVKQIDRIANGVCESSGGFFIRPCELAARAEVVSSSRHIILSDEFLDSTQVLLQPEAARTVRQVVARDQRLSTGAVRQKRK